MEDQCLIWGADFSKQREEQDLHALDHLFPRHYVPPPLAQAAESAEFPDCHRVSAACENCDFTEAAAKLPGLERVDMEAVAMLTLNDNRADSPFAVVNAALCHAKSATATTQELNERDDRLCRVCDYLWLVLSALRKLPRVPRSLLYKPFCLKPGMKMPVVGEYLISPGFLYVMTQWKKAKDYVENEESGGMLFVMHECYGYSVAPFSFFGHEEDLLLEPGTIFRIDEVTVKDKYTVVHVYRRDSPLYLAQRMAAGRGIVGSSTPSVSQQAQATASGTSLPAPSVNPEDGQQFNHRSSSDTASVPTDGIQPATTASTTLTLDPSSDVSGVAPAIPVVTFPSSGASSSGTDYISVPTTTALSTLPSQNAAAAETADTNLVILELLCPPSKSAALQIMDKNHLFFWPDNVNSTPLTTAIQTARLERGPEVYNAAQTFIEIMGTDLFPEDSHALDKLRSPLFNKTDAQALVTLTINDSMPNSAMSVLNHCFSMQNQKDMLPFADLVWYVLVALRKLAPDNSHSTLYRGLFFPGGTQLPPVGSTFVWSEFFYGNFDVESTIAPLSDLFPEDDSRLVIFELRNVTGYNMEPYSFLSHEDVRLVEPGMAFKVLSFESLSGGAVLIHTELVPGPLLLEHRMARYTPHVDPEFGSSLHDDSTNSNANSDADRARPWFNKRESKEQRDADAMFKSFPPESVNLDLSSRNLAALPRALYSLPNLRSLQLRCNVLTAKHMVFPPGVTAPLQGLQELFLYQNQLTTLPDCFSTLTNLQTLCLDKNNLRFVPPSIATMTRLRTLDLSNNKIKIIPDFFTQLCDLQILRITDNQVESLPQNIGQLTNLCSLNMKGNRLRTLPDSIGKLLRLQMLKVNENQLQSIPQSFGLLTQFKDLDFSHNQFEKVPDCLSLLPELKRLNFDDNKLKVKALPPWLFTMPSLQSLRLSNNPCSTKIKGKALLNNELVET